MKLANAYGRVNSRRISALERLQNQIKTKQKPLESARLQKGATSYAGLDRWRY